jgi:hypothetical protein
MRSMVLTTVALALAACTAAIGTRPDDRGSSATPTPTLPVVNVSDMMGMYPQQTVFVVTADHVSAVTLLNHFIRYRIPTQGVAEVTADPGARWLYLLDGDKQGSRRLRVFDVPTGTQHAMLDGITDVPPGGHVLGTASDGRLLVLKSGASQAWVDAYQLDTLQSTGVLMRGPTCSDRLLANASRIAMVCSSTGEVALGTINGTHATIDPALPDVVGAAMGGEGTLYLVTADDHLAKVPPGSAALVPVGWPSGWSGNVVADGLAVVQGGTQLVIAETNSDGAWLRLTAMPDVSQQKSFHLAGPPNGGVVAMWPFAYYAVDGSIRHVDLTSGLLETMAGVGPGAAAAAVVNG